jgi:hypothetical protein
VPQFLTFTASPTPTPVATDDGLNAAIAGALVGAAATAAITLLIFIIDRVIRVRADFRETRREVMAEYFDAMASFVMAATAPRLPPEGFAPQAAAVIAARSKLILALGTRHRSIGMWLVGMEAAMTTAAHMDWRTPRELQVKVAVMEARMRDVLDALTRLQERRLFVADFTLPGGVMMLALQSPDWARENARQVEWASKVQNAGRWRAVVAFILWARNRIVEWFTSWRRPTSYESAPEASGS